MTDITIPPEALEAAVRELKSMLANIVDADTRATELTDEEHVVLVNAACLAMLRAWPGMAYRYRIRMSLEPQEIILPLTQEKTNE